MDEKKLNELLKERDEVISELRSEVEAVKTNYNGLVKFVNEKIEGFNNSLNAVDNTAFAAFGMLTVEGRNFELSAENIITTRDALQKNISNFDEYRKTLLEERKKAAEKEAKKLAKKQEVQAKRDAKKGSNSKKAETKDAEETK